MKKKSIDNAVNYMLENNGKFETVWQRSEQQKPHCGYGESGLCCHTCYMGPCRISYNGKGPRKGVCGATAEIVVARNFARMIASGAAAHADHGREVARILLLAAKNSSSGYSIKDVNKLKQVARVLGISTRNRSTKEIAIKVAKKALENFGQQDGEISFIKQAPSKRQAIWRQQNVVPRGIDREIVEMAHRTNMGVDQDHRNIMLQATRTALADGWGGSMIATELQDVLFGTPLPLRGQANLGVLSETDVNIVVHGHEPMLSEMLILAAKDKKLIELAKSEGATGINLAGICCTASEILIRNGLPIAGNLLQQELAILTGALEAMIVDVQCIMPSLSDLCKCYHTQLITTSPKGKMEGARCFHLSENNALQTATEIIREAILNFRNRGKVCIPREKMDFIAGFSNEAITSLLNGGFRGSYRLLNENIINGRIKGIAAVVGCSNPKVTHDQGHVNLVQELIANDILVVQTGCSAIACSKQGLLLLEAAEKYAGRGLAEVCQALKIPPVLYLGSCVDNSRILIALSKIVEAGGLGNDISELPVAGAAPEWMSEKAISIGHYFVSSGVFTVFGIGLPIRGSEIFCNHLFKEFENIFGGKWAVEPDINKMARLIIDHINNKREKLGIRKDKKIVFFDMERMKIDYLKKLIQA